MEHHHFHPMGLLALLATLALNFFTWSGKYLTWGNLQQAGTGVVTVLMIIFYVYSIIEKRRAIKKMGPKRRNP